MACLPEYGYDVPVESSIACTTSDERNGRPRLLASQELSFFAESDKSRRRRRLIKQKKHVQDEEMVQ